MARKRKPKLSARQRAFAREYVVDHVGAAAARRAGYSERGADVAAIRLLGNARVRELIDALEVKAAERAEVQAVDVRRELALAGFSDIGQVVDFSGDEPRLRKANEIPEAARRALASMKVRRYTEGHGEAAREVEVTEFRLWDKLSALRTLAQLLGMLDQPGGDVTVNAEKIVVDIPGNSRDSN